MVMDITSCNSGGNGHPEPAKGKHFIKELNASEIPLGQQTTAIIAATIIDGNGGPAVSNGCVIVKNGRITEVGINGKVNIPAGAEIIDGHGMALLPGLIDAHFHLDGMAGLPALFLQHGVTSVRDPGAWIDYYSAERASGKPEPRLFLSGPHLDMFPPAYPKDAYIVRDAEEAVRQVNRMADEGASMIKVYFRLPPAIIREICKAAHQRGIPVTGHLEITEAVEAIEAGLDGIEHITSFSISLQPKIEGEKYRQAVLADNNARKHGRYEVWKKIDVNGTLADSLIHYLAHKGTFVTPTLGPFEYQLPRNVNNSETGYSYALQPLNEFDKMPADSIKLAGFRNMQAMTARMRKGGVRIVLGSHSSIPYAETGWAYQREMELLVESGLTPGETIVASTMENARNFRIDDRLGSIEKGKIADLVLVEGNPLEDIRKARNVRRVMLNGVWVK